MVNSTGQIKTAAISSIQHFSTGDGPGIRTTVFFQGCNLRCAWCHNPETISLRPKLLYYNQHCAGCGLCIKECQNSVHYFKDDMHVLDHVRCAGCGKCAAACPAGALLMDGGTKTLEEVFDVICTDVDFYKASGGGVTLSGGEPLLQADFCALLAETCRKHNIHIIIDTAGNVDYSAFEKVFPFTDLFFFDLKGANESDYRDKTGGSFTLAIQNLTRLAADGADITVRIPIIPQYNDNADYCKKLCGILKNAGISDINLLAFHRLGSSKYEALGLDYPYRSVMPPDKEKMLELLAVFSPHFNAKIDG